MATQKTNADIQTLERGNVFFFYRPRVEEEEPESVEEVQRFQMVLRPEGKKMFRLLVIGQKKLPDAVHRGRSRRWGFVETAQRDPERVKEHLEEDVYETKTRGERHLPAARPVGEGVYRILRHGNHTHFVYALELPKQAGEPQEDFNIEDEASYIISIKNPEKPSPAQAGLQADRKADYPKRLMEVFRDRQFAEADPPDLLDYEGAEFVLVPAAENISEELGITLHPEDESERTAEIFTQLHLDKQEHPLEPLFEASWK